MTKKILRKFYSKQLRILNKHRKKRILRHKTRLDFPLHHGISTLNQKSLIFNSFFLILHHSIKKGLKFLQYKELLRCFIILKIIFKKDLNVIFECLYNRITPLIKFLPKTFGRTVYKIPVKNNIPFNFHKATFALVKFSRQRYEESFGLQLAAEIHQCFRLTSRTIKWKQAIHSEAFENRANLTYLRYY